MTDTSSSTGSLARELVGTWELVSRIDLTRAGERRLEPLLGDAPIALLYYDRSGHFAAQFMKRDRAAAGSSDADAPDAGSGAPNNSRAQGGYDAYFGTYTVNEAQGTVTHHVQASIFPEDLGKDFVRPFTLDGDTLTLSFTSPSAGGSTITRTLTFRRSQ